ncbi:hypothetical protein YPPY96_2182, partial [Yersinia pestis PY-96]
MPQYVQAVQAAAPAAGGGRGG